MNRSEQIDQLAAALAAAQATMESASKGKINPHLGSKYADLASVWAACRDSLTANGLAVSQGPLADVQGCAGVETMLMHKSGQWLESRFYVPLTVKPAKDASGKKLDKDAPPNAQDVMAALTYARRGALSALVGIAPEDDDGESLRRRLTEDARAEIGAPAKTANTDAQRPAESAEVALAAQIATASTKTALGAIGQAVAAAQKAGAIDQAARTRLAKAFAEQATALSAAEGAGAAA